jgi:hypothetical protein
MSVAKRTDSDCFDRSGRYRVERAYGAGSEPAHEPIRRPIPSEINEGPSPDDPATVWIDAAVGRDLIGEVSAGER